MLSNPKQVQEFELIERIVGGATEDFQQLILHYQNMVFRVAIGLTQNKEDAEDITQEAFVKAFEALPNFRKEASFSTWLYRIALQTSLTHLKHKKRLAFIRKAKEFSEYLIGHKEISNSADSKFIENEQHLLFENIINRLPEKQRVAFLLQRMEGLSQKEIAEIMETSEGAVEQHLIRAKEKLKKALNL